jgi:dUTP pyrophosphatase
MIIQLRRNKAAGALPLPAYQTDLSAGVDLQAALPKGAVELPPQQRAAVPTGLFIAMPEGVEAQIRPRSGLALKTGLTVANAPGTIDADYRGEIKVLLINLGTETITIDHGMRIAQMIFSPVLKVTFQLTDKLNYTLRGDGGFGSTGFYDRAAEQDSGEPS